MSAPSDAADVCRAMRWLWSRSATAVAALLLAASVPWTALGYGTTLVVAFLACSAQCLALPLALRHPVGATALQVGGLLVLGTAVEGRGPLGLELLALPGTAVLAVVLQVVAVGVLWPPRTAVLTAVALATAVLTAVATSTTGPRDLPPSSVVDELVLYLLVLGLALFVAFGLRRRIGAEASVARAWQEVALEVDRRSLAEERTRIARELHDVVAHSMSSIHLQASSAPYRLAGTDPATNAEFGEIAAGSRDVMRDLGQLLRVLREQGEDGCEVTPVPGLQEIASEVAWARAAGTPADLVMDLTDTPLVHSAGLCATVFRVVQEGLRNVERHATGARTTVTVVAEPPGFVTVSVRNDAPPGPRAPADLGPGSLDDPDRLRLGLLGLEERARSLGGRLHHGPRDGGGHDVTAVLPVPGADLEKGPPPP